MKAGGENGEVEARITEDDCEMAELQASNRRLKLRLKYINSQNCHVVLRLSKETKIKLTIEDFNVSIEKVSMSRLLSHFLCFSPRVPRTTFTFMMVTEPITRTY